MNNEWLGVGVLMTFKLELENIWEIQTISCRKFKLCNGLNVRILWLIELNNYTQRLIRRARKLTRFFFVWFFFLFYLLLLVDWCSFFSSVAWICACLDVLLISECNVFYVQNNYIRTGLEAPHFFLNWESIGSISWLIVQRFRRLS